MDHATEGIQCNPCSPSCVCGSSEYLRKHARAGTYNVACRFANPSTGASSCAQHISASGCRRRHCQCRHNCSRAAPCYGLKQIVLFA